MAGARALLGDPQAVSSAPEQVKLNRCSESNVRIVSRLGGADTLPARALVTRRF